MKCPVCKTECGDSFRCDGCGFFDVNRIFINQEEATQWKEAILEPYKARYIAALDTDKYLEIHDNCLIKYHKESKIDYVKIPDYINKISRGAFQFCNNIKEIYIPDSVTQLPDDAFIGCISLERIRLSKNLSSIPYQAFFGCENLKEIHITRNINTIPYSAFDGCKRLERITLDSENKNYILKNNCLIDDRSKTLILSGNDNILPSNGLIKEIAGNAFHSSDIEVLTIPEGVTHIGHFLFNDGNPFKGCEKLKTLVFPESLECIGSSAVSGCNKIKQIYIPKNVSEINMEAFSSCESLCSIEVDAYNKTFYSINNCIVQKRTKKISLAISSCIIPSDGSVVGIEYFAFHEISRKSPLVIPSTIHSIAGRAFDSCNFDIYCEAKSKPLGWKEDWNYLHNGKIFWGDEWHYDEYGKPKLNKD